MAGENTQRESAVCGVDGDGTGMEWAVRSWCVLGDGRLLDAHAEGIKVLVVVPGGQHQVATYHSLLIAFIISIPQTAQMGYVSFVEYCSEYPCV